MRSYFVSGLGLALLSAVFMTAASAEEMSSDEILRRLQIQQETTVLNAAPGGVTRGLSLEYNDAPEQEGSKGIVLYQGEEGVPLETIPGTGIAEPSVTLDPIPYVDGTVATTAIPYQDLIPQPIVTEVYQPVREDARIDLRIYFEWNSASLRPEAIGQLTQLCDAINQVVSQRVFKIIGHTDKSGSPEYNLYLSEARAREVKRHLIEECAIPRDSLLAIGEGERQSDPGSPQRDPSERRVEVQLVG